MVTATSGTGELISWVLSEWTRWSSARLARRPCKVKAAERRALVSDAAVLDVKVAAANGLG